tara:strand:- start:2693 stop:3169 length:477 start_codon:yes stop_codon:yes gene_type:complete
MNKNDNYYINQDNINNKIYNRNIPSNNIEPVFDPRPLSMKYNLKEREPKVSEKQYSDFDTNTIFYPGTKKPTFSQFSNKIDLETELLHYNNKFNVNNNSDLYNNNSNNRDIINNDYSEITSDYLLEKQESNYINENNLLTLGNDIFNNNTRIQLKNIK